MKFEKLDPGQRKLLLEVLDIDHTNLKCERCGKKTTYDKCSIFPSTTKDKNATILCDSILCQVEQLGKKEDDKIKTVSKIKISDRANTIYNDIESMKAEDSEELLIDKAEVLAIIDNYLGEWM